jgi:hypothetical protein
MKNNGSCCSKQQHNIEPNVEFSCGIPFGEFNPMKEKKLDYIIQYIIRNEKNL